MLFADVVLARRIEAAEAANARDCARQEQAAVLDVAGGGCAIFVGADSPLTGAVGIGLNGPVSTGDLARLESFFRTRGARISIDLCPLADPALIAILADRGYQPVEFNNVLARRLASFEPRPAPRVRRGAESDRDAWSLAVGRGFFEQPDLTEPEMDVGRSVFDMPGGLCYMAADPGGEAAGGAALCVRDGLATLFADGIVPPHRRRGLHQELIAARLADAVAAGCDTATATTAPGSVSQRNYERMGFEVVYTKVILVC